MPISPTPKIELHVHLEGAVRPRTLLAIARRNGVRLPGDSEEELIDLYQFSDFAHFLDLWMATTDAVRTEVDFREIVVTYAREAAADGAVYIEGIFTPAERTVVGASWDEVFTGFCEGAEQARETYGVQVRLTPDIPRNLGLDVAMRTARYAVKYQERGIVGLGIGGPEATCPPELFAPAFRLVKDAGLGSVPHAGEAAGPASIRGALEALGADRIRHGVRAIEDAALLDELAAREIVCDVCPTSNIATRAVGSLEAHPLSKMVEAGVLCSISTDDPAMFGTDLTREYELAEELGCSPQRAFRAGMIGALCDEETRTSLRAIEETFAWATSP